MRIRNSSTGIAVLVCVAAVSPGCGHSRSDYVEFSQTEPTKLDNAQAQDAESAVTAKVVNTSETGTASATGTGIDSLPVADAAAPGDSGAGSKSNNVTASGNKALPDSASEQSGVAANPVESGKAMEPAANSASSVGSQEASVVESANAPPSGNSANPAGASTTVGDSTGASHTDVPKQSGAEVSQNAGGDGTPRTVVSAQSGLEGQADVPVVENTAASEPRKIELLIPEKSFRKERGTTALRVSYDDIDLLKILNMEPVPTNATEYFPEWLKSLHGKPIRIRGFMYPTFEATGLTEFTLARDNGICCFVRQPKIYDIIGVKLAEGVTTDYIEGRPFDVEGTFHIEPEADEKDLYRLYRIDNARVMK